MSYSLLPPLSVSSYLEPSSHHTISRSEQISISLKKLYPEHQEVQSVFNICHEQWKNSFVKEEIDHLLDVVEFTAHAQEKAIRKDGLPIFLHEIKVACILGKCGIKEVETIAAAILHHGKLNRMSSSENLLTEEEYSMIEQKFSLNSRGTKIKILLQEFDRLPFFSGEGRKIVIGEASSLSYSAKNLWLGDRYDHLSSRDKAISERDLIDHERLLKALSQGNEPGSELLIHSCEEEIASLRKRIAH